MSDLSLHYNTGNLIIQSVPVAIYINIPQLGVDNYSKVDDQWKADNVVAQKIGIEYIWNTKVLKDSIEVRSDQTTHMFVNMISNEITNRSSWGGNKKYKVAAKVLSEPIEQQPTRFVQKSTAAGVGTAAVATTAVASSASANVSQPVSQPSTQAVTAGAASTQAANYGFNGTGHSVADVEMVFVDGGEFKMGAEDHNDNEKPIHSIRLSSFYMSKYEITNQQFADFLNDIKCLESGIFEGQLFVQTRLRDVGVEYMNGRFMSKPGKEYYPIVGVTWYGANAYCKWAGGRLPTEAEWEYAAKGGIKSEDYIYSGGRNMNKLGWTKRNSDMTVHMVGQKDPNEIGLYDMSGNVYEWVYDWYDEAYYGTSDVTNPQGPESGNEKITRGGCFMHSELACRVSRRVPASPMTYGPNAGFRLYRATQ